MNNIGMRTSPAVCLVIPTIPPEFSGGGILAYNLASYFAGNHSGVVLIVTQTAPPKLLDGAEIISYPDPPLPISRKGRKLLGLAKALPSAIKVLSQKRPHIVHVMGASSWVLSYVLAARVLGIPVVLETSTTGGDDPNTVKHSRFGTVKFAVIQEVSYLVNVSPILDSLARRAGISSEKRIIIPNQVDIDLFRPDPCPERLRLSLGLQRFETILLNVAIIRPNKGIQFLIEEFATFSRDDQSLGLVLVGPTTKDPENTKYTERMKTLARDLGVADRVIFTGHIENVHEYMGAADIFVFASEMEGFGTVVVEAMASELPVLTKRINGVSDFIIEDGVDGLVADSSNDYRSKLAQLLESPKLRKRLGKAARRTVELRFSTKVIARQYVEVYSKLVPEQSTAFRALLSD
ncbi:glycosyltransferase family 4 protein [Microvenator marinus]|uniref:Glycosyltransferase family 4 protein n=1 Tax=Microvenator marinus TaxID=2600177 RepID=A0A5B8XRY1_9DELT|nr:glycosyltransferase family 4 protein [Microvenator marinus]QED28712.1 glycosyltransferase family 4 protein [Microvenator marinus]